MKCTDCSAQLNDYVDRELGADEARAVDAHLAGCPACRAELASLQSLLAQTRDLPREIAPGRNLWRELRAEAESFRQAQGPEPVEGRLDPKPLRAASDSGSSRATFTAPILRWFAPLAAAAAIVLLAAVAGRRPGPQVDSSPAWSVAALAGAPRVDARRVTHETQFRLGQWLETDASSRAKVVVGAIGEVTVDPNSRLRLAGVTDTNHRLQLQRGSLSAFIYAPPRLFFVDTPSATAVDLGCAYTLNVADNGDGELRVTLGYVALEHGDRQSLIPERAMCLTRKGVGPGTPFAVDTPAELRAALTRFDFEPGAAPAALPAVLRHARPEDAITLWHLLARTEAAERAAVFDRLAAVQSVPPTVTRAGILAGDDTMRIAWANALGFETFGLR